jgi:hypothetical protein
MSDYTLGRASFTSYWFDETFKYANTLSNAENVSIQADSGDILFCEHELVLLRGNGFPPIFPVDPPTLD